METGNNGIRGPIPGPIPGHVFLIISNTLHLYPRTPAQDASGPGSLYYPILYPILKPMSMSKIQFHQVSLTSSPSP